MSRDATVLARLYALTRGDLERTVFRFPAVDDLLATMSMIRLRRMADFWTGESDRRDALRVATTDLVSGLYTQRRPWAFVINNRGHEIECLFGVGGTLRDEPIDDLLRGAFPDVRLESPIAGPRPKLPHALVVTGTPSAKLDDGSSGMDQIERVVRGLSVRDWTYVVYADPVHPPDAIKTINEVTAEIRDASSTFLIKGSSLDENDRTARRYVDLLEAKLRRLEQARGIGLWQARVFLFAATAQTLRVARGLLSSAFSGTDSVPDPIRCCDCAPDGDSGADIEPLSTLEVALLARPPREEFAGYGVFTYARYGVDLENAPHGSIDIGAIVDRGAVGAGSCWIARDDLAKHVLVAGVTGSGKTTTCVRLLTQAWEGGRGAPFLVIESAKSEYRHLLTGAAVDPLTVFTVGNETVAPLRLNPFEVPEGTLVQTHIDYLKSLFGAAFVLYPPMPYVLEQSVQEVYEDRGWDVARNVNRRGSGPLAFPTLSDLAAKVGIIVDRMGYDERITMDVKAGLLARINQLRYGGGKGLMLDTRHSVPSEILFESPCLLELKSIVSDDEKAFFIGLLMIRLHEHCETRPRRGGLRHVTLIEEAHRLLRNTSTEQGSEISANPRGRAIEVFANMLSEIRAFGEAIVLAEQVPIKLVPEAIKNTNLKIVHRLVAADDRALLGGAMRLDAMQERRLALLETGEAVVFREGFFNPVMVQIPGPGPESRLGHVTDADLTRSMRKFYADQPSVLERHAACRVCPARGTETACGQAAVGAVDDRFDTGFRTFFTALRFREASLGEAYSDLVQQHAAGGTPTAFVCAVNCAMERELDTRGSVYHWSFGQTGLALAAAVACVTELSGQAGASRMPEAVAHFATLLEELQNPAVRPFPACAHCPSPCQFRVDVSDIARQEEVAFKRAFENRALGWGALADVALRAVTDALPLASIPIRKDAAFCYAAHEFAALPLSGRTQRDLGARMRRQLENGGVHGAVRDPDA